MSAKKRPSGNAAFELPKRRRTYQACISCRSRKVKCDLGPVDNPHDPPCARCKRELKKCIFSSNKGTSNDLPPNSINAISLPSLGKSKQEIQNDSTSPILSDVPLSRKGTSSEKSFKSEGMKWKLELSSMQNALEFLAQAAGTVAKEGAKEIIKEKSTTPKPLKSSLDATNKSATDEGLKRLSKSDSTNTLYENTADMLNHTLNTNRKTSQLMEEIGKVRPPPTGKLTTSITSVQIACLLKRRRLNS